MERKSSLKLVGDYEERNHCASLTVQNFKKKNKKIDNEGKIAENVFDYPKQRERERERERERTTLLHMKMNCKI